MQSSVGGVAGFHVFAGFVPCGVVASVVLSGGTPWQAVQAR